VRRSHQSYTAPRDDRLSSRMILKGIVAKRKRDPYRRGARWWKIKNPGYSQAEGGTSCSTAAGAPSGGSVGEPAGGDVKRLR
jgi:hypothetical protein